MAEDAEIESGTSFITRSDKNLLSDMAENAEVGSNSGRNDDKTVKRSPLFKKLNRLTGYFIFLCSGKR